MATTSRRRRVTGRDFEDEEQEETTNVRRRRRPEAEYEDEEPTPRHDEDEDEDDEPRSRRRLRKADDVEDEGDEESSYDDSLVQTGWKAVEQARSSGGDWTNDFRFTEDQQLVKFLSATPWVYSQHWVTREGKRSFPCIGKGCPLCKIGVSASKKIVFPIMSFGNDPESDTPQVMNLQTGPRFADTLKGFHEDPKVGPLDRMYWALSRSGTGRKTQYTAIPVKERDLEDDWNLDPDQVLDIVENAEIPDAKHAITWPTKAALQEIADEVME